MSDMLRQIATDKGLLVFNLFAVLDAAIKDSAFWDNTHLNQRGKALIATADTAIYDVMLAWSGMKMVAHESYRSGGYCIEGDEQITAMDVPFIAQSALAFASASEAVSKPSQRDQQSALALASAPMFQRTN